MSEVTPSLDPALGVDLSSGVRETQSSALVHGVRYACEGDAEALAYTHAVAWQVAYEQGVVAFAPTIHDLDQRACRWARRFQRAPLPTMVAVEYGKVVGYAALGLVQDGAKYAARIDSAQVRPEHWHGRAADNLLIATGYWLSRRGYRQLCISVLSDNALVQHLLNRRGFRMGGGTVRAGRVHTHYLKSLENLDW